MLRIAPGGVVLFDAVGTLLRPEPAVAEAYAAAGRNFGSQLTRAEIDLRFRTIFAADKAADQRDREGRTDEARERERWRSIVAGVFDDVAPAQLDALFEDLWSHFARPESWRAFDDARPTLARLSAAGHVVAIASNFDQRLPAIVAALLPEIPPERTFVSSMLGYRKPAAGFFRACERKLAELGLELGIAGESITLIGDDLDEDFRGAQAAGWQAILLDRGERRGYVEPRLATLTNLR